MDSDGDDFLIHVRQFEAGPLLDRLRGVVRGRMAWILGERGLDGAPGGLDAVCAGDRSAPAVHVVLRGTGRVEAGASFESSPASADEFPESHLATAKDGAVIRFGLRSERIGGMEIWKMSHYAQAGEMAVNGMLETLRDAGWLGESGMDALERLSCRARGRFPCFEWE